MGGTYTQVGDYLLPDLKLPEKEQQSIGVCEHRHLRYIKQYKHLLYFNLLTIGKLNKYLASIDEQPVSIIFYISRMKYSCRSIVTFSHSFIPQNIMQDKRYKQSVSKPFV